MHAARSAAVTRVALALLIVLAGEAASADRMAVIVHSERRISMDLETLAQIYLKRRRYWSGGDPIVPINREAGSPSRNAFQQRVLGLDASRLAVYWNREYFRGVLPPPTLASDEAILRFVAEEPRAIGYVDADAVDDSVRVVLYVD
jgi:ABC-type phosphate transport system substrate-binding protein